MIDEARIRAALSTVRDPELDEPITELGFVQAVDIAGEDVRVELRLPTYFCAPNFAYLMASDAQQAVTTVDGVRRAEVCLVDHFSAEEINEGLAEGHDFDRTFPGDASGEGLDGLRELFRRKAFLSRQRRVCRSLGGVPAAKLAGLTLADLPDGPDTERYLGRRGELGIDCAPAAPFLVMPDGRPIAEHAVEQQMRLARTVEASLDINASFCRSLLETRYGTKRLEEARA